VPNNHEVFDLPLAEADLRDLGSADALAAFFSRLRWATNSRIVQQPQNLGITADGIRSQINRIERLASQSGVLPLEVYLFELKSVTKANRLDLTNAFKNKAGNFILVLTSPDYDKLDFIAVDKTPDEGEGALGVTHNKVRPRVLSLDRRNPDAVRVRALRRLTYTETDSISQFEKVRRAFIAAEWSDEYFNNRALFSDYYLRERLPLGAEWAEDPMPSFRELRPYFLQASSKYGNKTETDLKRELYEPLLRSLGFSFKAYRHEYDHPAPDYALFAPGDEKQVLACALTYAWGRSLDGKDPDRDAEWPEENPGAVVVSLLEKGDVPWVIVTNGKVWRLYGAQAHSRATNYYEIDVEDGIAQSASQSGEIDKSFRYFWLLFRRAAFEKRDHTAEGQRQEQCFLDKLLKGSQLYARELEKDLKERVFTQVFPKLAEGFIENLRQKRGKTHDLTDEFLDQVFHGTLTLLYRLLFLFYAESRNLLPVREIRGYWIKSLEKQRKEIAEKAGPNRAESDGRLAHDHEIDTYDLYTHLADLFKVVDKGEAAINVPMYNGGLFLTEPEKDDESPEAEAARFLNKHRVPDRHLAFALDRLSRAEDKRGTLALIDYKSLGVRQLGSIYEGLLEFKVRVAGEKLAIVKEKNKEVFKPFKSLDPAAKEKAERKGNIVGKGHAYLENDRQERKATGSYYTPDYIVKYIVDRTVGPTLQTKLDALRPRFREAEERRRREMARQEDFKKKGMRVKKDPPLSPEDRDLAEEVFNLKVLDPAMGSGHFLVEAVDFVTDRILAFLNGFHWNPVAAHLDRTRREIMEEMDAQFIQLDPDRLTDVNLLKRHVLKRCIYGVDLNPMAVELAKVSLWLDCFTLGAPLSFLDHHLRCGNSLIGATVGQVEEAEKGQLNLLLGSKFQGLKQAVGAMISIGGLPDATASQVKASRAEYHRALDQMCQPKRLLHVYTSQWFGNEPMKGRKGESNPALEFLRTGLADKWAQSPDKTALPVEWKKVADRALKEASQRRFFHWELEFPEVFYARRPGTTQVIERDENGGFDAVIGNPPYVRQEGLGDDKAFYQAAHKDVFTGVADLYVYFYHQGLTVCRPGGRFGMITSNKYLRAGYGEKLREYLKGFGVEDLVDFGDLPLFDEAIAYPMVYIAAKTNPSPDAKAKAVTIKTMEDAEAIGVSRPLFPEIQLKDLRKEGWVLERPEVLRLMEKIRKAGKPLGEVIGGKFYYGVKTGFNEAFVIDEAKRKELIAADPKSVEIIKPFLRGQDIKRWKVDWAGLYLIKTEIGVDIKRYPAIFAHLKQFQKQLEKRWDKGEHWWELRACDYYAEFEKPKIIWPDIAPTVNFSYARDPLYVVNTAYILPSDDLGLLAVLNSKVTEFCYRAMSAQVRGGYLRFIASYINEIPIPGYKRDDFTNVVEALLLSTDESEIKALESKIDHMVEAVFGLSKEEIAIIHEGG